MRTKEKETRISTNFETTKLIGEKEKTSLLTKIGNIKSFGGIKRTILRSR